MTTRYDPARDSLDDIDTGEHIRQKHPGRLGRPPVEDKRRVRSYRASNAEQARIVANAAAKGMTIAAYVRSRCAK